jgi:polysaccharide biosynthesis transport protein
VFCYAEVVELNMPSNDVAGIPQDNGAPLRLSGTVDPAVDATHLKEIFGALSRQRWLVFGVSTTIFAIAAWLAFSSRPTYQAHAVIRLADARRAYTGGFDDYSTQAPLGRTTNLITSELEILLGRTVLGEVVDREGLRLMVAPRSQLTWNMLTDVRIQPDAYPRELHVQFDAQELVVRSADGEVHAPYGLPVELAGVTLTVRAAPRHPTAELWLVPREMAIDYLAESLQVFPRGSTNAVSVRYTSMDPFYAQRVVNTAVEVFRDHNARSARQQAELRRAFLEQQLGRNEVQLTAAQEAFGAFQAREEVYSSRERLLAQEQELVALTMRREELDSEHRMYTALLAELERVAPGERAQALRTLLSASGVAANSIVSQLYAERASFESEIDRLTTGALGSTADHPDVQRLRSLIESTEARLIAAVRSQILALGARVAALDSLRERTAAGMRRLPEAHTGELRLMQQLEALGRIQDKLTAELHEARMAETVEMGQVEIVYLAPLPTLPVRSRRARTLAVGLILGIIFGTSGALARETLNTSVRRREELEKVLRVAGLAIIPRMARSGGRVPRTSWLPPLDLRNRLLHVQRGHEGSPWMVDEADFSSAASEAYRILRANLIFAREVQPLRSVVIASALPGEGRTTTAANLAVTFARQGTRVLLIDFNPYSPRLHVILSVPREPGLYEALLGHLRPEEAVYPTSVAKLYLLAAGSADIGHASVVSEEKLAAMLDRLTQAFDLVIIDTPPVLKTADAAVLARMADGVIIVVRAGATDRTVAQQAVHQLTTVGARIIGAVLNDPDGKVERYGNNETYCSYVAQTPPSRPGSNGRPG